MRALHGPAMRRRLSTATSKPQLVAFNSLTGQLDAFPTSSSPLKWYVCGPTVYDSAHLGHARSYVSQDILRRVLTQHFHQEIFLVMGMTDVDDKIIAAAASQQTTMTNIARTNEAAFLRNLADLNVLRVSSITRVSEHIPEIIAYIQSLGANGFAYVRSDGVYFDTVAMGAKYGKLAPNTPQEYDNVVPEDGAVGGEKRNVRDFALWKLSKSPEEPGWESPWGRGRPGWHIECSAMTHHVLGDAIDVHSGGVDLRFPHHNNEIAQCDAYHHHACGTSGSCLKMSKSLKNFITIDSLLETYSADTFRVFCLQYKYNMNVHFSEDRMRDASAIYQRFLSVVVSRRVDGVDHTVLAALAQCKQDVDIAMRHDFDTPRALQHLLDLISQTNKTWKDHPSMSVEVLCTVATYIVDMLTLFGLATLRFPSLRLAAPVADDPTSLNSIQANDVMDAFTTFRANVRALALTNTSDKVARDILNLCDNVRCVLHRCPFRSWRDML
ncbi:hypothetical protein DYB32_001226 [Aphanomyces invadans]|uniref:cysteine--tRNA ligase n=1 Tax=Aphanomyces invadans TaxID=157072 RepID=A0A3R7D601_9STRA|nr:hypothetical protein DYB32_001226 [Aphanomyces invadans]